MAYVDVDKAVGIGYLSDWYQSSIDDTKPPIWTDEHIEELTNDFIVIPKDTPTADVAVVKHGWWKMPTGKLKCFEGQYVICSECNVMLPMVEEIDRYWYCPNCGAKMGTFDNKELARQMRENAVRDQNGAILCSPELWEDIANIIEKLPTVREMKGVVK